MRCEEFLPLVERLADGEVSAAEKREAEAHLEACEECREHFRFLEALPAAARQALPSEPPAFYWETLPRKIMTRIADMEGDKPTRQGWLSGLLSPSGLRWAGALAAALVAAVVGLQVLDAPFSRPTPSQPSDRDAPSLSALREVPESAKEEEQRVVESALDSEETFARESTPARSPAPQTPPELPEPRGPEVIEGGNEQLADESDEALQKARAVAGREELDDVASTEAESQPESDMAFESAGAAGVRQPEVRDEVSGQPLPAPAGAQALRGRADREVSERRIQADATTMQARSADEDYRVLLERYPLEEGALADAPRESAAGGPADRTSECSEWRRFVEREDVGDLGTSARYRLALCSLALYELQPSDAHRRQAIEDGEAFLAAESSGARADAIRQALEGIGR